MTRVDPEIQSSSVRPITFKPSYPAAVIFLWMYFILAFSYVRAEENIGYYVKIAQDSTSITWQKIWGANFPEVEDYEMTDGDVVISLGGGGDGGGSCSGSFPDPQFCSGFLSTARQEVTTSSTDSDLPPVVVTGTPIGFQQVALAFFIRQIKPEDTGGGIGGPTGDAIAKPLNTSVCDVNNFKNIQDETVKRALLSPSTLDGMKDIAQSSKNQGQEFFGRIIRTDSVVSDAFSVRWESEGAFANVTGRTCDGVDLSISPLIDFSNSIIVHTHPSCSGNLIGPSQDDIQFIRDFRFMGGLTHLLHKFPARHRCAAWYSSDSGARAQFFNPHIE